MELDTGKSPSSGEQSYVRSTKGSLRLIILSTLFAVLMREIVAARTVLLTEIPLTLKLVFGAIGFAIGCVLSWQMSKQGGGLDRPSLKNAILKIFFPVLGIFTYTYLGRWMFEIFAFANTPLSQSAAEIRITDAVPKGKSWGYRLDGMAFEDGREIEIFVTRDLHDRMEAIQPRLWTRPYVEQQFCITLQVDQGRWGALRAHVPALWDDAVSAYSRCRDQAAS